MKHIVRAGLNPLIAAIKAALEYLIYGKQGRVLNYTPVDILIKENVDYV